MSEMDYRDFRAQHLPRKAAVENVIEELKSVLEWLDARAAQSAHDLNATKNLGHQLELEEFAQRRDRVKGAIETLQAEVKPPRPAA